MKTITKENAETKSEISALIYANHTIGFREFTNLVESMMDKYVVLQNKKYPTRPPCCEKMHIEKNLRDGGFYCTNCDDSFMTYIDDYTP